MKTYCTTVAAAIASAVITLALFQDIALIAKPYAPAASAAAVSVAQQPQSRHAAA